MAHRVPRSTASWAYVFGSATLILFVLQIVTGICLALVYVPSADQAYESLNTSTTSSRSAGSCAPCTSGARTPWSLVMTLHMIQVFLFGAHKYPRELTWVAGVLALPVHARHGLHRPDPALGSGRLLGPRHRRLDRGAACRIVGSALVHALLGGPIIAGRTLSRFFTLHVFVIPGC